MLLNMRVSDINSSYLLEKYFACNCC